MPLEDLPFDEPRGVIPNEAGRVQDAGEPLPGEYVAGWIKRGPTGIIGTNKRDAQETVDALLADLDAGSLLALGARPRLARGAARGAPAGPRVLCRLGGDRPRREGSGGEPQGRPRVKLCSFEELLEAARERVS